MACNGKKKKKNDVQDGKILKEATAKNRGILEKTE
jgi:hypothetical protein